MPCGTDQRACNLPAATPPQYQVLKRREHFKLLSNIISNFRSIKEGVKNKARSILKICKNDYRFLFILIFLISIFPQFFVFSFLFRFFVLSQSYQNRFTLQRPLLDSGLLFSLIFSKLRYLFIGVCMGHAQIFIFVLSTSTRLWLDLQLYIQ